MASFIPASFSQRHIFCAKKQAECFFPPVPKIFASNVQVLGSGLTLALGMGLLAGALKPVHGGGTG